MPRFQMHPILIVVFGLAIIGLGYQLVTDPLGLLTYLIVGTVVAVGLYFLFTRVIAKRLTMNQYKTQSRPHATRQRQGGTKKQKYAQATTNRKHTARNKRPSHAKKRKNDHHLKVIEGKKNSKKNRALF